MTNTIMTSVQTAASQLLDALSAGKNVTLDVTFQEFTPSALELLMGALHEEARRRGVGVTIEPVGETSLCLSLHRP